LEGPNLIFLVRGEARRAKPEAKMADSGGGVLEEGEASPPYQLGGLAERCKLPSGVRGGATATKRFSCILAAPDGPSCNLLRPGSEGGMPLFKSTYVSVQTSERGRGAVSLYGNCSSSVFAGLNNNT